MIVPHYDAILHAMGTSREDIQGETEIQIPVTLLKFLLTVVVENGVFNEAGYLAENPDVASAVKSKKIASGRQHYLSVGFFEGRRGALPEVDESWYRKTYADVATAIRSGRLGSAKQHFNMVGAEEFRAPSREFMAESFNWKVAFGKAQPVRKS
ncbi:MAG: hypothetical protein ACREXR_02710 [Gammaproteobacteria bacterium]